MLIDITASDNGNVWHGTATLTPSPPAAAPAAAAVTPPLPPPPGRVPGVHDPMKPALLRTAYPGVRYTRQFVPGVLNDPTDSAGLTAKVDAVCGPSWAAGLTPIVSIKPNVAQVMAGRWKQALADLGASLSADAAQGRLAIVVIWHEPEDDMTADAFVPYFNTARQQLKAGGADVPVAYAAMAYQWAPSPRGGSIAGHTENPAVWAQVDADIYAVDVYSGRSFPLGQILPEHPGFARWHNIMIGTGAGGWGPGRLQPGGRVWMVTERGFETDAAGSTLRADTITREVNWLRSTAADGCIGWVYWNTPGTEGSTTLSLDPAGQTALRNAIASLRTTTTGPLVVRTPTW